EVSPPLDDPPPSPPPPPQATSETEPARRTNARCFLVIMRPPWFPSRPARRDLARDETADERPRATPCGPRRAFPARAGEVTLRVLLRLRCRRSVIVRRPRARKP